MTKHKLSAIIAATGIIISLGACGTTNAQTSTASAKPETSTSTPAKESTATVEVEGTGTATDVTVTIVDPDTGLTASHGSEGLSDQSGIPGDTTSKVGDSHAKTESLKDVQLPYSKTYTLTQGQNINVSAQNGTSGNKLTAKITVNGTTKQQSSSGDNTAVTVTSKDKE